MRIIVKKNVILQFEKVNVGRHGPRGGWRQSSGLLPYRRVTSLRYNADHKQKNIIMKRLIFLLSVIALSASTLFAQNTNKGVNESQFIGKYTFADAKGNNYDIDIKKSNEKYKDRYYDERDVEHPGYDYYGLGTCTVNGESYYFNWFKDLESEYIEIAFSWADRPNIEINGNAYKSSPYQFGEDRYYIKSNYFYYDRPAMDAENPKLRFKLTKKQ